MAAPAVTGIAALLLQDFRDQFPLRDDPWNSTVKIFLAHTATDLVSPGPDYQTGYGSVRIQQAIDFMRSNDGFNFLEAQVDQGGAYPVLVVVEPGATEMRVTLAWDDEPGTPNVAPALVNDLDLVVYDPDSVQHLPWTLDPGNPVLPAVQTQADRVNNIEQVYVAAPMPGTWRVEVRGFNVPVGPQTFSLCGSPCLLNCSSQGILSLDRPKYTCLSEATLQVVDCDLNADDGTGSILNAIKLMENQRKLFYHKHL